MTALARIAPALDALRKAGHYIAVDRGMIGQAFAARAWR